MATTTLTHTAAGKYADSQWRSLCKLGGIAALLQLVCVLTSTVIAILVGTEPANAEEYFSILEQNRLAGLLRLDFATLILICLYPLTSFGMYAALRDSNKAYSSLAVALIFTGTILALAPHSAFSMIGLSDQFAAATRIVQQEQLLAAGEAVISSDMWHSTSGFLAGIFMQGGSIVVSVVMLGSKISAEPPVSPAFCPTDSIWCTSLSPCSTPRWLSYCCISPDLFTCCGSPFWLGTSISSDSERMDNPLLSNPPVGLCSQTSPGIVEIWISINSVR
jgi:hypothetical protein